MSVAEEYSIVSVAPTTCAVLGLPAPKSAEGPVISEVVESMTQQEKMAILAPDAFGYLMWERWKSEVPFLTGLANEHLLRLRCVMPSVTPVNFATIVSGVGLTVHGVRKKEHDFKCETVFDVVRTAGHRSAGFGQPEWTGSDLLAREADIDGTSEKNSDDSIVKRVLEVLDEESPKFIIAQIGETDDIFHEYGPSSPEVIPGLRRTDQRLKHLVRKLIPLGYGIIILADHGQHDCHDREDGLRGIHGTDSDEDCLVPLTWVQAG